MSTLSNEYINGELSFNKENQQNNNLNMSRHLKKRHGMSKMITSNSDMNETDEYKQYNGKSHSNSKHLDSKSFIEENSLIENLSIASNQFNLKSSQKNFWTHKMSSFVSLLLEKEFLDSSLNYESIMEVYQAIAFKDEFKNNLRRVTPNSAVLHFVTEQYGHIQTDQRETRNVGTSQLHRESLESALLCDVYWLPPTQCQQ
jgi:hypothetical protein